MRSSERTLFIIQLVSLIILLLVSIFHGYLTDIGVIVTLSILLVIIATLFGLTLNDSIINNKSAIKLCLFYSITFLILRYSLGLITGFYRSTYNLSFIGILKNTIPAIILIVLEEICRYNICKKSDGNKLILLVNIFLFTFINFSLFGSFHNIATIGPFLRLFTTTFMTWLFYNIGLTIISYKYGLKTSLIYASVFYLYRYLIPIFPGFSEYVSTIMDMLIPIVIVVLLHIGIPDFFRKKKNKEDIRNKHLVSKITSVILFILIIIVVSLNSNIFRFWACVVGSGSMEPTISIGDIIIIDKSYKNRIDDLKKDDILVFQINKKYYTHRIVEVKENNGEKSFVTQGDREGQAVDDWIVTKNEVVGLTKFNIKYLGLPSIWIRDLMKEK